MLNQVGEVLGDKTISQYKIIEEKYHILKRYLKCLIMQNRLDINNVECILSALEESVELKKESDK